MTPEERKQAKEAERRAALTALRAGTGTPKAAPLPPMESQAFTGLELSDVMNKAVDWFHPDPENEEFTALKDRRPQYWEDLKRDIQAAGILTPLLAVLTPDGKNGFLLQGHSRLKIAREIGLKKVPCRLVLSPLTPAEIRSRRRLDNLLRFEIDENTRLAMLAQVWPEFYLTEGKAGNQSDHGDTITAGEIAEKTGKSVPQVKRDRATVREAAALAQEEGHPAPKPEHIAKVKEKQNEERRAKEAAKKAPAAPQEPQKKPQDPPVVSPGAYVQEDVSEALARSLNLETVQAVLDWLERGFRVATAKDTGENDDDVLAKIVGYRKAQWEVDRLKKEAERILKEAAE